MNEDIFTFPIRHYSFNTVPKEYTEKGGKNELSSLTPYLFLLLETEGNKPYWQYIDMAGSLSMIHFTDDESYAKAKKIIFGNGSYMYQIQEIYLKR